MGRDNGRGVRILTYLRTNRQEVLDSDAKGGRSWCGGWDGEGEGRGKDRGEMDRCESARVWGQIAGPWQLAAGPGSRL